MKLKSLIIFLSLVIVGCNNTQDHDQFRANLKVLNEMQRVFGKIWKYFIFRGDS